MSCSICFFVIFMINQGYHFLAERKTILGGFLWLLFYIRKYDYHTIKNSAYTLETDIKMTYP